MPERRIIDKVERAKMNELLFRPRLSSIYWAGDNLDRKRERERERDLEREREREREREITCFRPRLSH